MVTGPSDSIFVDSNILIYASSFGSPYHLLAKDKLDALSTSGSEIWISRQVIREFFAVMSRVDAFQIPTSRPKLFALVRSFSKVFRVADENDSVTECLLQLLGKYSVSGKRVHDANIVATMLVYGIRRLITANTKDFSAFTGLIEMTAV